LALGLQARTTPSHPRREPAIGLIAVDLHAKGVKLAALKKVTSFVFKHFLASFPRFCLFNLSGLPRETGTTATRLASGGLPALGYDKMSTK
jgi:hypothetical protein